MFEKAIQELEDSVKNDPPNIHEPGAPRILAFIHYDLFKENRNPYKKLSGQWNQYENWFLNAKLREESKDEI